MTTYIVHRFGNGAGNKFFEHISRVLLLPHKTVFVHLVTLWVCTSSEREPKIASDFVCNRARIMQKRYIRLLGPVKAHWKLHWTNLNSEGKPISLSEEQIYRNIFTTLTRFDHNTHSYQWQDDRKKKQKQIRDNSHLRAYTQHTKLVSYTMNERKLCSLYLNKLCDYFNTDDWRCSTAGACGRTSYGVGTARERVIERNRERERHTLAGFSTHTDH